jgi:hypothetical protein
MLFHYYVVSIHTSFSFVVDCVWGAYGEWSTCSATCGGGSRTRTRTEDTAAVNGGVACSGSATETESCNSAGCPGSKILKAVSKFIIIKGNYLYFYVVALLCCYYSHVIFICS